jgi:hypothetical protein
VSGEDKVKLVGEVNVGGNAAGELKGILAELKLFREQWVEAGTTIKAADTQVVKVTESSGKLGSIWTGIWQGVGQKLFTGLVSGLVSIGRSIVSQIDQANAFGDVFQRMSARGVEDVGAIEVAVVSLATAMRSDLVQTAELVEEAMKLGVKGAGSMEVIAAAMRNEEMEGYSAMAAIEGSTRVRKALNLTMKDQADMIAAVGEASLRANVSQSELYSLMTRSMAYLPKLNASWKDLLITTENVAKKGLLPMRQVVTAMVEGMRNLAEPTEEMATALQNSGIVSTASGVALGKQSTAAAALRTEVILLTTEMNNLVKAQTEIQMTGDEASRRISRYEVLQAKQTAGTRLNKLERSEMRELKTELKDYNQELSKYDTAARFVENRDFKRLDVLGQLKTRVENLKIVQGDLSEDQSRLAVEQSEVNTELDAQTKLVSALSLAMQTEMPSAIQTAIGASGLGGFMTKVGENEDVLKTMTSEVKVLLTSMTESSTGAVTSIDGAAEKQKGLWQEMQAAGYGAWEKLKALWDNLSTVLAKPLSDFRDAFSLGMSAIFGEEFMTLINEKASEWAVAFAEWGGSLGEELAIGVMDIISGEKTLGEVLSAWVTQAWEKIKTVVWPQIREWLVAALALLKEELVPVMKTMGESLWTGLFDGLKSSYFNSDFNGWLSGIFSPLTDWQNGVGGGGGGGGGLFSSGPPVPATGGFTPANGGFLGNGWDPRGAAATKSQTINVYTADPSAAAREVIKLTKQTERLGG